MVKCRVLRAHRPKSTRWFPAAALTLVVGCASGSANESVRFLPPLRDDVFALVENRLLALQYHVEDSERRLQGFTIVASKRDVAEDFTQRVDRLRVSVTDVRAPVGALNAGETRGHNIRVRMFTVDVDAEGNETQRETPSDTVMQDAEALLNALDSSS
jgi:hypothetical protein